MNSKTMPSMNLERISRMKGKSIDEIAKADLNTSNFEEYYTSRFWSSDSVYKWILLILPPVKAIYRCEYESYKEQNGRTLNFAS